MSTATSRLRRVGVGGLAAVLAFGIAPASAVADFQFERVAGDTRFDTSAEIAARYGASNTAILASGVDGHYADALSANYLAGQLEAPILLTRQAMTPEVILDQLEENGVEEIYIVGGPVAVSTAQEQALEDAGYDVTRVQGDDRFETAEAVIAAGGDASDTALITTGYDFADALAAGPLAYTAGMPVALSGRDTIRPTMIAALEDAGVDQAIILGGPLAIAESVQTQLEDAGIDVITRLADQRRSGTSVAIANYAIDNGLLGAEGVNLATGREPGYGADALSGGPLTGEQNRTLLITENATTLSSEDNDTTIQEFLTAHAATLTEGLVFGGPIAVSDAVVAEAEEAAQTVPSNQDFTVTPTEAAQLTAQTEAGSTPTAADDRQYTASGLTAGTSYEIRLFPADYVTTDANGVVSFRDTEGTSATNDDNSRADQGTVQADITVVNGTPIASADNQASASPVNGVITFTVDGVATEMIVPVVFANTDNDGQLDLDANNQPTEEFGVGGAIDYLPAEMATGAFDYTTGSNALAESASDGAITRVEDTFFIAQDDAAGTGTPHVFAFDSNDLFYIDEDGEDAAGFGTPDPEEQVTLEQFVAELSVGDNILGEVYQQNEAFQSTFLLYDDAPAAPTTLTAGTRTDTSVVLTVGGVVDDASQVTIYGVVDPPTTPEVDAPVTTSSTVYATATADADANTTGFQVQVTGLTGDTSYDFAATQTVAGEESGLSPEVEVTTLVGPVERPTVTNAYLDTDEVTEGLADAGDVWYIQTSEPVKGLPAGQPLAEINMTDADGDTIRVVCNGTPAADDALTAATCTFGVFVNGVFDGTPLANNQPAYEGDLLQVTLLEVAEDRNAAGNSTPTVDQIHYPLTITSVANATDVDEGNTIDLANSADVIIDLE